MNTLKRAAVYPFSFEFSPIMRYKQFVTDYQIIGLASLSGWALGNKDASCADDGSELAITVTNNLDDLLADCDAIILAEPHISLDIKKVVLPKIKNAINEGKDIVCLWNLHDEIRQELNELCKSQGNKFYYFGAKNGKVNFEYTNSEEIYDINTPVILISGLAERTQKFQIQLGLRKQLLDMGYRVSQIGSRHYCEFLGFHSFPQFMYGCSMTEIEKIVHFNRFVKNIEQHENPDVILIGVPGGIMPFNSQFTNKFGITAYEVSKALDADILILSVLYEDYKPQYFQKLLNSTKYTLGIEPDCFNLANIQFDWMKSKVSKQMTYFSIDHRFIDQKKKIYNNLSTPVYNSLNEIDMHEMACHITNKLSAYSNIKSI